MNTDPIILEQDYDAPIESLWKMITDPAEMKIWFFEPLEDFRAEVGFETRFNVHFENQDFMHHWLVSKVDEPNELSYHWKYDGITGEGHVHWSLSSTESGSHLRFICEGGHTFPQDNPLFSRESATAGWDFLLRKSLPEHIAAQKNS